VIKDVVNFACEFLILLDFFSNFFLDHYMKAMLHIRFKAMVNLQLQVL
jgi:hypothetical protein